MTLLIPTAITRWRNGTKRTFYRDINIRSSESLTIYNFGRLVIRWSPISVALKRLLKEEK